MRKLFLCAVAQVMAVAAFSQVNVQLHYDLGKPINPDSEDGRQPITTTVEFFKADKLGSTFFFIDMDYHGKEMDSQRANNGSNKRGVIGAYWEVSRDFTFAKVKDTNVSFTAHAEYDGGLAQYNSFQQAILVGPALQWHNADFRKTFTFQALYKHMLKANNGLDGHASFQTTAVWGLTFANDLCTFSGFADLWYAQTPKNVYRGKTGCNQRGLVFLTEPQFWFNIVNRHKDGNKLSIGTEWEMSNNFIWYNYPAEKKRSFYWNPTIALKWSI
ncbi:MAG TPA: DUF5020 domain-containing protein [Prevotellaceae bacterium]|nr:DUF5020 domain-containing protein [Prevotellaceae bacterium]HBE54530.1 DUF5020 domain-containing protein [Prevotellaceae bacterium]